MNEFLYATAWAIQASIWQMAILYFLLWLAHRTCIFSATVMYYASFILLLCGTAWSVHTFLKACTASGPITSFGPNMPFHYTIHPLWINALAMAYIVILSIRLAQQAVSYFCLRSLHQKGIVQPAQQMLQVVEKVRQSMGFRKTLPLRFSALLSSPAIIGFFRPVILFPVACLSKLSISQTEAILLHELYHLRRHDNLVHFVVLILQNVFFFNPFTAQIIKILHLEREASCDDFVIRSGNCPVNYIGALLSLKISDKAGAHFRLASADDMHLLQRCQRMAGEKNFIKLKLKPLVFGIVAMAFGWCLHLEVHNANLINVKKPTKEVTVVLPKLAPQLLPESITFSKPHISRSDIPKKTQKNSFLKTRKKESAPEDDAIKIALPDESLFFAHQQILDSLQWRELKKKQNTAFLKLWLALEKELGNDFSAKEKTAAFRKFWEKKNAALAKALPEKVIIVPVEEQPGKLLFNVPNESFKGDALISTDQITETDITNKLSPVATYKRPKRIIHF